MLKFRISTYSLPITPIVPLRPTLIFALAPHLHRHCMESPPHPPIATAWCRPSPPPPVASCADARVAIGSHHRHPTSSSMSHRLWPDSAAESAHWRRCRRHPQPPTSAAGPLPRTGRRRPPCSFVKGFFSSLL
jgi:hypothetical protein